MKWDWRWVGSEDGRAGFMDMELCEEIVSIQLSSYTVASRIARLIEKEIEGAKREGMLEALGQI